MIIDHLNILDNYIVQLYVSNQGKIVNFCWIPSHICIPENNEAGCKIDTRVRNSNV